MSDILTIIRFKSDVGYIDNHQIQEIELISQPDITCSNLTTETLEQGVKYAQS